MFWNSTLTLKDLPDLIGKKYIITGGTAGLGLASAIGLYEKNATIVITARNEKRGQEAMDHIQKQVPNSKGSVSFYIMDQSDLRSVKRFAEWVIQEKLKLDGLLLNAGICAVPFETKYGIESQMLVNHLSHFYLVELLLEFCKNHQPFRIVYVSSSAYEFIQDKDIDWNAVLTQSYTGLQDGFKQYAYSKLANIYHALYLSRNKGSKDVYFVNAIHPGVVSTNITSKVPFTSTFFGGFVTRVIKAFSYSADTGALTQLYALTHSDIETNQWNGVYFAIAHNAIKALINLSTHSEFIPSMSHDSFLKDLILMIVLPKTLIADLCCMLLNNLSKDPKVVEYLIPSEEDGTKTSLLDNLIEVFARGEGKRYNPNADFHFIAGVLSQLTAETSGAQFMLGCSQVDSQKRLQKLIVFLGHSDHIRRGGVASVIKNCCFDLTSHIWLLTDSELNLLPFLLLPLMGPEDYDEEDMEGMPDELQLLPSDKIRENDSRIRLILVETLLLLASTRQGRDIQRSKKVYPILQKLHLWENSEPVKETIERLVVLIMGEEKPADTGIQPIEE